MIVRTITCFGDATMSSRGAEVHAIVGGELQRAGYTVQTVRYVLNAFNANGAVAAAEAATVKATLPSGTLFSVGALRSPASVAAVPSLSASGITSCVIVPVDDETGVADRAMCRAAAQAIVDTAKHSAEGNFCFAAVCPGRKQASLSYAPFFPAAHVAVAGADAGSTSTAQAVGPGPGSHASGTSSDNNVIRFSIGCQFPSVVRDAIAEAAAAVEKEHGLQPGGAASNAATRLFFVRAATAAVHQALASHYQNIADICERCAAETGSIFVGIDGSIAPLPSDAPVTDIYRLLGVAYFGAPGTLEASSLLTRILKTVPMPTRRAAAASTAVEGATGAAAVAVAGRSTGTGTGTGTGAEATRVPLIGYTGLMLPPMEDAGLAVHASEGRYGIAQLLMCSSVCGVGLDTVPIPGDTRVEAIEGLIADVAALAHRLDKPLSVRLFPVPGLKAGDKVALDNPHLCDTSVFAV